MPIPNSRSSRDSSSCTTCSPACCCRAAGGRFARKPRRSLSGDSTAIFHSLPQVNWVGFYFLREDTLVLGPFQGKPACVRIKLGQGVCGAGAAKCETVIVPNVHEFPGHIACDSASNSEIVVPLLKDSRLIGVLDLDSPQTARFDQEDAAGLETLVRILLSSA